MSRIGRSPIPVPSGVTIEVTDRHVKVTGPKGTLERDLPRDITVRQDDAVLMVERPTDQRQHRALHGLTRSLVNNMVVGVTDGFTRDLEIVGVGYRAAATTPSKLDLASASATPSPSTPPRASPSRRRRPPASRCAASTRKPSAKSRPTSAVSASPSPTRARAS